MRKTKKELEQEYINLLKEKCCSHDTEQDHVRADELLIQFLIELGFIELAKEYDCVDKWYS